MPVLDEDTAWQHCEESRPSADKLLIRPYEVDQAGTDEPAGRQIPTKAWTCVEPVHLRVMPAAHRQQAFSQCTYLKIFAPAVMNVELREDEAFDIKGMRELGKAWGVIGCLV